MFDWGSYTTRVSQVNTGCAMSTTHELMDRVRERKSLNSDASLARFLGVQQSTVSNWRQGTRHPQPWLIDKMATAIEEKPIAWALRIQADRDKLVDPTNAKVWLRWAQSVAAIALTVGLYSNTHAKEAQIDVQTTQQSFLQETVTSIHYAKLWKGQAWLNGLGFCPLEPVFGSSSRTGCT